MTSPIKKIIIFVLVGVVLVVVYFYFFSGKTVQTTIGGLTSSTGKTVGTQGLVATSTDGVGNEIGREFLSSLLNLKTLTLSDKLFTNDSFRTLEDFSIVIIPPIETGRPNPFAPVVGMSTTPTETLSIPPIEGTLPPAN